MKSASFEYVRADSLATVCRLLAGKDRDSRIIAGGQTLVPLMAMRLVRPEQLIDVGHVPELKGIRVENNSLVIGACVTQRELEASPLVARHVPLLALALPWVGHVQTRNRGTAGGSLCNADPSAEIPLVTTTLDATLRIASARGIREVVATDFFVDAMETVVADDECLVHIRFPIQSGPRCGSGFAEVNARSSDFAIVAAAAEVQLDANGTCQRIACAVAGASPKPVRCAEAEQTLEGKTLHDDVIDSAVQGIVANLDAGDDVHASARYRERVAKTLVARAIAAARDSAITGTDQ